MDNRRDPCSSGRCSVHRLICQKGAAGKQKLLSDLYSESSGRDKRFLDFLILGTEMAAKEYRADIEIMAPEDENDVEGQNRLLEEAIEKKPDAILFPRPALRNQTVF